MSSIPIKNIEHINTVYTTATINKIPIMADLMIDIMSIPISSRIFE